MSTHHRRRRLLFAGLAGSTLLVILWAAYLFTGIWLRVRCARELAEHAESLPVVTLPEPTTTDNTTMTYFALRALAVDDNSVEKTIGRLESLQHTTPGTIFRELFRKDEPAQTAQTVYSVAFSPSGQQLATASGSTVRLWSTTGSSGGAQTLMAIDGSGSVSVQASVQTTNRLLLGSRIQFVGDWSGRSPRVVAVTDSSGEKLHLVTRPRQGTPSHSTATATDADSRPNELLLVDSAGRIFARLDQPDGPLLGKLAEPHGKADQLVFGRAVVTADEAGQVQVTETRTISIIEHGRLKALRQTTVSSAGDDGGQPPQPTAGETPDEASR